MNLDQVTEKIYNEKIKIQSQLEKKYRTKISDIVGQTIIKIETNDEGYTVVFGNGTFTHFHACFNGVGCAFNSIDLMGECVEQLVYYPELLKYRELRKIRDDIEFMQEEIEDFANAMQLDAIAVQQLVMTLKSLTAAGKSTEEMVEIFSKLGEE